MGLVVVVVGVVVVVEVEVVVVIVGTVVVVMSMHVTPSTSRIYPTSQSQCHVPGPSYKHNWLHPPFDTVQMFIATQLVPADK